jgi:hypothetical protein
MKTLLALLAFTVSATASAGTPVPAPRSACDPSAVLAAVNVKAPDVYRPGARARVGFAGRLPVAGTLNVMLLVDDFNVKNTYGVEAEVFTIVGSSLASETTAWIAVADGTTCELKDAWEALHTGGGGL